MGRIYNANRFETLPAEYADLDRAILECLCVENDKHDFGFGAEFQDNRGDETPLDFIARQCESRQDSVSDHVKLKAEKAKRIAIYRQQVEQSGEFEFEEFDVNGNANIDGLVAKLLEK